MPDTHMILMFIRFNENYYLRTLLSLKRDDNII